MDDGSEQQALHDFLTARGYTAVALVCNAAGHFELADAQLDGVPVRLLLDTGASHTVIERATAARLAVASSPSQRRGGGVGGTDQTLTTVTASTLQLGEVSCHDVTLYAMDLSHVSAALAAHGGSAIDGAVGGDLLRPRNAVIDYAGGMLYLRAPLP